MKCGKSERKSQREWEWVKRKHHINNKLVWLSRFFLQNNFFSLSRRTFSYLKCGICVHIFFFANEMFWFISFTQNANDFHVNCLDFSDVAKCSTSDTVYMCELERESNYNLSKANNQTDAIKFNELFTHCEHRLCALMSLLVQLNGQNQYFGLCSLNNQFDEYKMHRHWYLAIEWAFTAIGIW